MARVFLIGLLVTLSGCEVETSPSGETTSSSEIRLRELLPADAVLVGVTVAPDGKRYVLDQRSGLYEIGDNEAKLVFNATGLNGVELTDVVALDADRFALTAENDGFLFDARTQTFASYFCYLPAPPPESPEGSAGSASSGGSPSVEPVPSPISVSQTLQLEGIAVTQRTESVAFNPGTRQLFAQPRTIRLDTGSAAGSEVFVFNEAGGQPISVIPLSDASFVAAGMVVAPGDRLLLGAGSDLFEVTLDGGFQPLRQLDGAIDITGMARAPNGDVWLLDGAGLRLIKLEPII